MPGLQKRSLNLAGHSTSMALEPEFWATLEEAAQTEEIAVAALVARIDDRRGERPLASACRLYCLAFVRARTGTN